MYLKPEFLLLTSSRNDTGQNFLPIRCLLCFKAQKVRNDVGKYRTENRGEVKPRNSGYLRLIFHIIKKLICIPPHLIIVKKILKANKD